MKKFYFTLVIVIALMAANALQAESSKNTVNRGIANYTSALQKGNEGLTESAISKIMKLKVNYPDMDYTECINELVKLSKTSPSKVIRMKANMAANTLQAEPSKNTVNRGIANYASALQKGNEGLTGSAISKLMNLKVNYPDMDYTECINELVKLSETSPSKVIRMEAYMAAKYIQNPEHFYLIEDSEYREVTGFFDNSRIGIDSRNVLVDAK